MTSIYSSEHAHQVRTVLYEELAEYYYRAVAPGRLTRSSVKREIEYHAKNITLLSLYFDSIIITSATIFNVRDAFVSKVISGFLSHDRTREMLEVGVLKILGWGGSEAPDMFDAASEYSTDLLKIRKNPETLAQIGSVFEPKYTISRSTETPDSDLPAKYINRLENTSIVSNPYQLSSIRDIVLQQQDFTKSLIAIEVLPSLDQVVISKDTLNIAKLQLFGVTIEHMRDELPGLWVYSPFLAGDLSTEAASTNPGTPRAFLASPMVFGSFLDMHVDAKVFGLLMNDSFHKLHALKNGDWNRFAEAYHQAIADVSTALSLSLHLSTAELRDHDAAEWAEKIVTRIKAEGTDIDISAFIDSLANLGSVLLAVPVLRPMVTLLTTVIGDRLSDSVLTFSKKEMGQVSPFIAKLERAYSI